MQTLPWLLSADVCLEAAWWRVDPRSTYCSGEERKSSSKCTGHQSHQGMPSSKEPLPSWRGEVADAEPILVCGARQCFKQSQVLQLRGSQPKAYFWYKGLVAVLKATGPPLSYILHT